MSLNLSTTQITVFGDNLSNMENTSYTIKETLEHYFKDMKDDIKEIKEDVKETKADGKETKAQVQKTNGRVTALEQKTEDYPTYKKTVESLINFRFYLVGMWVSAAVLLGALGFLAYRDIIHIVNEKKEFNKNEVIGIIKEELSSKNYKLDIAE